MSNHTITAGEVGRAIDATITGDPNITISDVTHDSRQAGAQTLFAAIEGLTMDGHKFVDDVMRRGAAGVISERPPKENFDGLWFEVKDARKALADAAAFVHRYPSREIDLVGITGTNGKTTTTYLVLAIANSNQRKTAMLTTVEYRIGDDSRPAVRTTPESSDTQRFLREAITKDCTVAVMEASSQAIHLRRCDNLEYSVAVFSNLTRDHLDYHETMDKYYDAKKELFDGRIGSVPKASVINIDDKWGLRLLTELQKSGQRVISFSQQTSADFTALNVSVSLLEGTKFNLLTPAGEIAVTSPLVGRPHVYNMLCAAAVGLELGFDLEKIAEGFKSCIGAPGRFERVPHSHGFAVIVDYAHSDDALVNTLGTAADLAEGRIITVFGCGGDRDKTKRAPMGKAAGENSDVVIVTSDNPRTEDPLSIIKEIEAGISTTDCEYQIEPDRREAIFKAIAMAMPTDVIIIAGKGHETYQIVGNDKFHFDDREIASEAVNQLDR